MVADVFRALCWFALSLTVQAGTYVHDDRFQPDEVLRVSQAEVAMACRYRDSVVVNGTAPGPQLRIKPDKTTWVRVYNDMDDQNLTMASRPCEDARLKTTLTRLSTGTVCHSR
jgi:hypothetical protein